ncbi:hypothetical protein BaRGS_00035861 [Batillaria attramentaria]|uniref:Uncharacterized protein n=1 Tax=Batillaria attramentaria TaxID=370345 RepID=A0ABD0JEB7_9CAEN
MTWLRNRKFVNEQDFNPATATHRRNLLHATFPLDQYNRTAEVCRGERFTEPVKVRTEKPFSNTNMLKKKKKILATTDKLTRGEGRCVCVCPLAVRSLIN